MRISLLFGPEKSISLLAAWCEGICRCLHSYQLFTARWLISKTGILKAVNRIVFICPSEALGDWISSKQPAGNAFATVFNSSISLILLSTLWKLSETQNNSSVYFPKAVTVYSFFWWDPTPQPGLFYSLACSQIRPHACLCQEASLWWSKSGKSFRLAIQTNQIRDSQRRLRKDLTKHKQ